MSFFQRTAPELADSVQSLHKDREPLFEKIGVEDAFSSVSSAESTSRRAAT